VDGQEDIRQGAVFKNNDRHPNQGSISKIYTIQIKGLFVYTWGQFENNRIAIINRDPNQPGGNCNYQG
jgi:hypothetical protein